jgi:hypothetical protein
MPTTDEILEVFTSAIHEKKKVEVRFDAHKYGDDIVRICAPMDYGPHARYKDGISRFHFWNYRGPNGAHTMPVEPAYIISIKKSEENFEPSEFVTWTPRWHIPRDWGVYS